jgi:valyl-tRNA synthetase
VPIEPYFSDQWYVRVTDDRLVGEAQRALVDEQDDGGKPQRATGVREGDGELRFFPARYAKMYQAWHDNLRDWCISRQLWWGHRIPVWSYRFDDLARGDEVFRRWHASAEADVDRIALRHVETPDGVELQLCFGREDDTTEELIRRAEADGFERDPDVLDTWFSSALWPLNTMGWPDPAAFEDTAGLLETFNPTSVLCTGRDIITLWVSRMVMFNRHFNGGKVPFRHVYINPMIQDGYGQRMSKSLGNGVDPRDIIHSHGADALRYSLVLMATSTQDCRMPVDMVCPHCAETFHPQEITSPAGYRVAGPTPTCPKCGKPMTSGYGAASGAARPTDEAPLARNTSAKFDRGRNFANKLWNATRFALHNLEGGGRGTTSPGDWTLVDRWIITRLHRTLHVVEDALADYQFSAYAEAMDDFVWRDFCDWYLEAIKPTVRSSPAQQQVLRTVLDATLRLLHPICPFITEALWPHVCATGASGLDGIRLAPSDLLATAAWPDIRCSIDDDEAATTFERVKTLVGAIRLIRAEKNVPVKRRITLHANDDARALIDAAGDIVQTLAGLETVAGLDDRPGHVIPLAFEGGELFLSNIVDAVDVDAERDRLGRLIEEMESKAGNLRGRLANDAYLSKAPAHLVEETRGQLAQTDADLDAARRALESLDRAE